MYHNSLTIGAQGGIRFTIATIVITDSPEKPHAHDLTSRPSEDSVRKGTSSLSRLQALQLAIRICLQLFWEVLETA